MNTITAFEFQDLGVDSPSYFQGAGTAFTDWDEVFVGVGDTAREAAEDALESLAQSTDEQPSPKMYDDINQFDDETSAHAGDCTAEHGPDCEMQPDGHDECDLQHYVALYVRGE